MLKVRSLLLSMALDGQAAGKITFAAYQPRLGKLASRTHTLDITAFGPKDQSELAQEANASR